MDRQSKQARRGIGRFVRQRSKTSLLSDDAFVCMPCRRHLVASTSAVKEEPSKASEVRS